MEISSQDPLRPVQERIVVSCDQPISLSGSGNDKIYEVREGSQNDHRGTAYQGNGKTRNRARKTVTHELKKNAIKKKPGSAERITRS